MSNTSVAVRLPAGTVMRVAAMPPAWFTEAIRTAMPEMPEMPDEEGSSLEGEPQDLGGPACAAGLPRLSGGADAGPAAPAAPRLI